MAQTGRRQTPISSVSTERSPTQECAAASERARDAGNVSDSGRTAGALMQSADVFEALARPLLAAWAAAPCAADFGPELGASLQRTASVLAAAPWLHPQPGNLLVGTRSLNSWLLPGFSQPRL